MRLRLKDGKWPGGGGGKGRRGGSVVLDGTGRVTAEGNGKAGGGREWERRFSMRPAPSHPHIQRMVERMGEGRQSGLVRMGTVGAEEDGGVVDGMRGNGKDAVIDVRES